MLEPDRPGTRVPGQHIDCQRPADAVSPYRRRDPESGDRTLAALQAVDQGETDWRILAGLGVRPPGQVSRPMPGS
jgi:hypothetical protein